MTNHRETQREAILRMLRTRPKVTNFEFIRLVTPRYSARIHELRNEGHLIVGTKVSANKWEYTYQGFGVTP